MQLSGDSLSFMIILTATGWITTGSVAWVLAATGDTSRAKTVGVACLLFFLALLMFWIATPNGGYE